jgi:hypothetical protein
MNYVERDRDDIYIQMKLLIVEEEPDDSLLSSKAYLNALEIAINH